MAGEIAETLCNSFYLYFPSLVFEDACHMTIKHDLFLPFFNVLIGGQSENRLTTG